MSVEILNRLSTFDPISNNLLCFVCSSNRASDEFSNIFLTVNGVQNTNVEKRKIVSVLCQLLHVKWDRVQELFIGNVHFPFCEKCSKFVIDIIGLREQLLGIKLKLQKKIKKIETTIAHSFKSGSTHSVQSKKVSKLDKAKTKSYNDYRQSFQHDVMEEYLTKKLPDDKITETKQTIRSGIIETDLPLIQFNSAKNVFENDEYSNDNMSVGGDSITILSDSEELDTQKKKQISEDVVITISDSEEVETENKQSEVVSPKPIESIVKTEPHAEIPMNIECEFSLCLVTQVVEEIPQIASRSNNETHESLRLFENETNRSADSDDSRNDPDYVLPKKKSRVEMTPKNQTELNQNTEPLPITVADSNVGVVPEVETSSETLTNENLSVRCTCGATDDSFILMCKFCGKQAHTQQKRLLYIVQSDTPKSVCPFCPAKFEVLNELREHAQFVHFPIPTPTKSIEKDNRKNFYGFASKIGDEKNNLETLQRRGLYYADEIMESPSEGEAEAILNLLSSESSSSDDEIDVDKTINATTSISPISTLHVKDPSMTNRSMPGTTIGNREVIEYMAKDKTIWTTLESTRTRTRAHNILREDGKLLGKAADTKLTPAELFKLMVSPDIVDLIVKYTNMFGHRYNPPDSTKSPQEKDNATNLNSYGSIGPDYWKPTYAEEMYAYIGIVLYFGLEKKTKLPLAETWCASGKYSIPCITATMSRDRFRILSRCLRFDDWIARSRKLEQGLKIEKLSYISEVFNPFVENLQSYLRPYDSLVVDELIVEYRGKSGLGVRLKSKPGKIGIKLWACCDGNTGYILRLIICEGKEPDKVVKENEKKVVLDLVEKYFGTGRGVTTAKCFTSKALALELVKQNMSLLGALRRNSTDIIPRFTIGKGRERYSSIFAFQNDLTMLTYIPRTHKSVVLLSTQHHAREFNSDTKHKPIMILDYNKTKGAMDIVDSMIAKYSCQRASTRWPVKLFYAICDIGALNAYNIWKIHQQQAGIKQIPSRLTFLRMVSEVLMEPLIKTRAQKLACTSAQAKLSMKIMGFPSDSRPPDPTGEFPTTSMKKSGKCEICVGHKTVTRSNCMVCYKRTCKPHYYKYTFCPECNPYAPGCALERIKGVSEATQVLAVKDIAPIYSYQFVKDIASGKELSNDMTQLRSRNYSVAEKISPQNKFCTSEKKVQPEVSLTGGKEDTSRDKTPIIRGNICRNIFPPRNSLGNKKGINDDKSDFEDYDLR